VLKERGGIRCPKCGETDNVMLLLIPQKGGGEISVLWCLKCENVEEMKGVENGKEG